MLSRLKNVCDNAEALIVPGQDCAAHNTWLPNTAGHISIFGLRFSEPLNVPWFVSADKVAMAVYQLWLGHESERMVFFFFLLLLFL